MFYGGEVVGESAIKHFDEIGTEVTHKYSVENRGPWRVDELQVEILWPYQVENGKAEGKWLLYMTEHPIVDGELLSCRHCTVKVTVMLWTESYKTINTSLDQLEGATIYQYQSGCHKDCH